MKLSEEGGEGALEERGRGSRAPEEGGGRRERLERLSLGILAQLRRRGLEDGAGLHKGNKGSI